MFHGQTGVKLMSTLFQVLWSKLGWMNLYECWEKLCVCQLVQDLVHPHYCSGFTGTVIFFQ